MTDYSKLVKALRCELHYTSCPVSDCKYICHDTFCDTYRLMVDAAAAIEALQDTVQAQDKALKECARQLAKMEPKRGEWVEREVIQDRRDARIPEWQQAKCSVCGKWHTTPYMYCFDDFDYCPNCGAKMEVQDGQKES